MEIMNNEKNESAGMRFLYNTAIGRAALRIVVSSFVSVSVGAFMSCRLSKPMIKRFVRKNGIDMSEYEDEKYRCFNDFFIRRIKPEKRPFDISPDALVAPCDGCLSVYKIDGGTVLPVKQSLYTIRDLLDGDEIAKIYDGGYCLVFRLTVKNYHRYAYTADGRKNGNTHIKGVFHTVRPIALAGYPVFVRNTREYTTVDTEAFGRITQVEVGAALVGKIKNLHGEKAVARGEEKGMFMFGGSTVIQLIEPEKVRLDDKYESAVGSGAEIPVLMGERIGGRI